MYVTSKERRDIRIKLTYLLIAKINKSGIGKIEDKMINI